MTYWTVQESLKRISYIVNMIHSFPSEWIMKINESDSVTAMNWVICFIQFAVKWIKWTNQFMTVTDWFWFVHPSDSLKWTESFMNLANQLFVMNLMRLRWTNRNQQQLNKMNESVQSSDWFWFYQSTTESFISFSCPWTHWCHEINDLQICK